MALRGTGVAIVTPFQQNGTLDFDALQAVIDHLVKGGVDFIVSLGTTGETATLTKAEKKEVVEFTAKAINNRVELVVGCGGYNTQEVINDMAEMEQWADFSTFLSVSPYYNKPSQEGLFQHYKAIAQATSKNIVLYNVPGRTSRNIEPATVWRLAKACKNIIGLKEAGNSISQSIDLAANKPDHFSLLSGDDDLLLAQLAHGFDGVISVVANAYPKQYCRVVELAHQNNIKEAREIYHQLIPFTKFIFEENNPAGIKCALHKMDLCGNYFRLPVTPVQNELQQKIEQQVDALKF